jgi:hypothetical protein
LHCEKSVARLVSGLVMFSKSHLYLVWYKDKHLSKAAEAFLDFFMENIATEN